MSGQKQPSMSAFTKYINEDYEISLQFGVPPCPVCSKLIKDDDKAVQCYKSCKRWFHKECINLRFSVYMKLEDSIKLRWSCERPECRSANIEEDNDWRDMQGAELLIPENDRVLVLPENNIYTVRMQDRELLPSRGKELYHDDGDSFPGFRKLGQDKELIAVQQQVLSQNATNELMETYRSKFSSSKSKEKKKKIVTCYRTSYDTLPDRELLPVLRLKEDEKTQNIKVENALEEERSLKEDPPNELLETFNKRYKIKEKLGEKKKIDSGQKNVGRIESFKNYFTKNRQAKKSASKQNTSSAVDNEDSD